MPKIKALVLFSGGLDSLLAVKTLELQNIEVTGLCFASNFFSCDNAKKSANENNINLRVVDIGEEILDLIKNPPNGYGKNLNPCLDCHSLMIKKASEIMRAEKYDIIATGEVLGQRPFSQNKGALERVKKISGVDVLRPLSAKLLPETEVEKQRLVNRGRLLNINGRTRDRQMELAEKYKLIYPSPAGGCLLTDLGFSERMIKMLSYWPDCQTDDAELLKHGRIFWANVKENSSKGKVLIVVARDLKEDIELEKLAAKGDIVVELKEENGPITLIRSRGAVKPEDKIFEIEVPERLEINHLDSSKVYTSTELMEVVLLVTGYYATKARGKKIKIKNTLIK